MLFRSHVGTEDQERRQGRSPQRQGQGPARRSREGAARDRQGRGVRRERRDPPQEADAGQSAGRAGTVGSSDRGLQGRDQGPEDRQALARSDKEGGRQKGERKRDGKGKRG